MLTLKRTVLVYLAAVLISQFTNAQSFSPDAGLLDAPSYTLLKAANPSPTPAMGQAIPNLAPPAMRPFSHIGASFKVGVNGIGFDIATPLGNKWNLRGGASFLGYTVDTSANGMNVSADLHLRSAVISADFFPMAGGFRLSPGIMIYNGNHINALFHVPGGKQFDLGDGSYISSPTDPVHGTGYLDFSSKVAPTFTIGYGNLIPRNGGHWSFPIEVGFAYIGDPKVTLDLHGTACRNGTDCGPIDGDAESQADLRQEERDLASDLSPLRFFPILNVGVGYRF